MMEAVKNAGFVMLFFSIYYPMVMAYMAGGFGKLVEMMKGSDPNAPAFVKYGEAYDY